MPIRKKAHFVAPENNSIYTKQQRRMFSWYYSTWAGDLGAAVKGTAFNSLAPGQHGRALWEHRTGSSIRNHQFSHLLLKPIARRAGTTHHPAPPRGQEGRWEALVACSSGREGPPRPLSTPGTAARPSAPPASPDRARYRSPPPLPGPAPPTRSANRVLSVPLLRLRIGCEGSVPPPHRPCLLIP